jgi:hypothetical protein
MVTNTTGTAKRARESFLEVNATAQQARNGVQMAIKKTVNIQRVLENAPKRVPFAGNVSTETASRAKAEKYAKTKNSKASAKTLAAYGSFGKDPGDRSTSRPRNS